MADGAARSREQPSRPSERRFSGLAALKGELKASGAYDQIVGDNLGFGQVWSIADTLSKAGFRGLHPWVVVVPPRAGSGLVEVSIRTTTRLDSYGKSGLVTPAIPEIGLDQRGCIVFGKRLKWLPPDFQLVGVAYLGRLPEEWRDRLREALDAWAKSIAEQGEGS